MRTGTAGSPWETYWDRPGSFGPHNLHENRPGSFQSESLIFSTWNNAGLRLYDGSTEVTQSPIAIGLPPLSAHGLTCY